MLFLNSRDERTYSQLVKLANGNAALVLDVLSQRPLDLGAAIEEIERRREPETNDRVLASTP